MVTAAATAARLCKLDESGKDLPADATEWSMVRDDATGLMWPRDAIDGEFKWKDTAAAATAFRLGGFDDWRVPTIRELLSIVDYERFSPAINTDFFRCDSECFWTASPWASSPASCAWGVFFDDGDAGSYHHDYKLFVRPVRSVAVPGQ